MNVQSKRDYSWLSPLLWGHQQSWRVSDSAVPRVFSSGLTQKPPVGQRDEQGTSLQGPWNHDKQLTAPESLCYFLLDIYFLFNAHAEAQVQSLSYILPPGQENIRSHAWFRAFTQLHRYTPVCEQHTWLGQMLPPITNPDLRPHLETVAENFGPQYPTGAQGTVNWAMRFYPFPLRAQVVFIVFKYIPNHIFIYIGGSAHEDLTRDVPQTKHKTQVSRVPSGRRQHPADGSSTSNSCTACLGHMLSSHRDLVWTRKTTRTSTGVKTRNWYSAQPVWW